MAIKWRTNITFHNWHEPSQLVKDEIIDQCLIFQNEGKYTGGFSASQVTPENPAEFAYERWWWIDETTAREYVDVAMLAWGPDMQKTVTITSEEVPD